MQRVYSVKHDYSPFAVRSATQIPFSPASPAQSKEHIQITGTITPGNTDVMLKSSSESQGKCLP